MMFCVRKTFDGIGPNLRSDTINEGVLLRHVARNEVATGGLLSQLEKLQRRAI